MGRQINFFMLPADEEEFIKFMNSTGNVIIYPYSSKKKPFEQIKISPKLFSVDFGDIVWLYNNSLGPIKYYYLEKPKNYFVDREKSPVIEFSRSRLNKEQQLLEGRIWIATAYVTKDFSGEWEWVKKPKEFIEWYEKIARWLRKNYMKYRSVYISKRVLEWLKKGGKLSTGIGQVFSLEDLERWKRYAEKEKRK